MGCYPASPVLGFQPAGGFFSNLSFHGSTSLTSPDSFSTRADQLNSYCFPIHVKINGDNATLGDDGFGFYNLFVAETHIPYPSPEVCETFHKQW